MSIGLIATSALRTTAHYAKRSILFESAGIGSLCINQKQFSTEEPPIISIDRSGLYNVEEHTHAAALNKETETPLTKQMKALIRFRGGPITLAEYMSEVLTNPTAGYYMNRDVFGQAGDFTTSPEISQLFGEMVGIWSVLQWQQLGCPPQLNLVEMGPGRGTLMADLLRGTKTLQPFSSAVHVHLVEVSKALREIQQKNLTTEKEGSRVSKDTGAAVRWHRSLDEVPNDAPAIFILHEFFDALPVHQFQNTDRGWCERLVDIASPDSSLHFQMVLSPRGTPASNMVVQRRLDSLPPEKRGTVEHMEVSAQSIATAASIAERVGKEGGAALIIDYGQDLPLESSLQAIKGHRFVHPLSRPGEADLSCHVDFSALRQGAMQSGAAVAVHGPIPQAQFLGGLGIEARLDALLAGASETEQTSLITGFNRLIGGQEQTSTSSDQSGLTEGQQSADLASGALQIEGSSQYKGPDEQDVSQQDGMGYTYKVMAITGSKHPVPPPFSYPS